MPLEPTEATIHKVIHAPTIAISVAVHAAMGAIWVGMLLFMAPRFLDMFADLDAALPLPTQIVLTLAGTMRRLWPLFGLLAVGLLGADAFLMSLIGKKIKFLGALAWNSAVMIVLAALALVTLLSMYLPIFTAVEAL